MMSDRFQILKGDLLDDDPLNKKKSVDKQKVKFYAKTSANFLNASPHRDALYESSNLERSFYLQ